MRICLGVHATEVVPSTVYFNHLVEFAGWAKRHELAFVGCEKVTVAKARNFIVKHALGLGCTHWMSVDTDHYFRPNALDLLVENADAAMVSGLICKRGFPFETVAFKRMPNGVKNNIILKPGMGVVEVDGCAMGCTLINLEWVQKLDKPWFYDSKDKRSDLTMCENLQALGGHILVDTRVEVGHRLVTPVVWPETADEARAQYVRHGVGQDESQLETYE